MSKERKQYSSDFKAKVTPAALKGDQATSELTARFEIHPTMVSQWKHELLGNATGVFESKSGKTAQKSYVLSEKSARIQRLMQDSVTMTR